VNDYGVNVARVNANTHRWKCTAFTFFIVCRMFCIVDLYADFGVFQRIIELDKAFPGASVLLFKQGKLPKVCWLPGIFIH